MPSSATALARVIERSKLVLEGQAVPSRTKKFSRYAISNFRGGIGKSTLTFNLAYEVSRENKLLLLDTCSQKNLSQSMFGEHLADQEHTLYQALVSEITNTGQIDPSDLAVRANPYCDGFKGGKSVFAIPGSAELFLFPSLLYSQLAQFAQLQSAGKDACKKVLLTLKKIVESTASATRSEKVIIDTSPFFGGATHLAWCAAEALVIPVRVDQNSIEALHLTLRMLKEQSMDFHRFNQQAGLSSTPKIHAIAMTHCGWSRQSANTPDSSTKFFAQKAIEAAQEFSSLFSETDVSDCFYLLDDFHSSGRISGNRRLPLSRLNAGEKHIVDGQRLEVNPSVDRYKREIKNLAAAL
ncbi:MAG: ParA family protein [Pseudomonadota bacterium]